MELSTLEWLKLNNNELRSLPYTLMEPVLMSLKYIDVYSECHGIIISAANRSIGEVEQSLFSVIVKTGCGTDGLICGTNLHTTD